MSLSVRDVIKTAGRLIGAWASGDDPTADEAADALVSMNRMKRSMFGTIIGPRLSPRAASGNPVQAETGGEYQVTASAPFNLLAPLHPRAGARFGVVDASLNFAAAPPTILGNGQLVNGASYGLVMNITGQNLRFWFRGDTGNWVIETDYASLDAAIEFPDGLIDYMPDMLAVVLAPEYGADLPPAVIAAAAEGREAFARAYGRRGRNGLDQPIGVAVGPPSASAAR